MVKLVILLVIVLTKGKICSRNGLLQIGERLLLTKRQVLPTLSASGVASSVILLKTALLERTILSRERATAAVNPVT